MVCYAVLRIRRRINKQLYCLKISVKPEDTRPLSALDLPLPCISESLANRESDLYDNIIIECCRKCSEDIPDNCVESQTDDYESLLHSITAEKQRSVYNNISEDRATVQPATPKMTSSKCAHNVQFMIVYT